MVQAVNKDAGTDCNGTRIRSPRRLDLGCLLRFNSALQFSTNDELKRQPRGADRKQPQYIKKERKKERKKKQLGAITKAPSRPSRALRKLLVHVWDGMTDVVGVAQNERDGASELPGFGGDEMTRTHQQNSCCSASNWRK